MHTPSPKFFCPRCKAAFGSDTNFCGQCGADMHRASSLIYRSEASGPRVPAAGDHDDDAWLGELVDSRYRVIERIGHGGMGVVYKIVHERMGKVAAMKVLHSELATDREILRRFRREAQAVSQLTHPNTVQVFDFGTARGALYLVMELVRGRDLGALLKRDGPMPFERAAPLIHQVCGALAEAHSLGIVHRDLKPENVLVTRTREGGDWAKVLDFGLAKLSEREEASDVTGTGAIVGTPYYMSPEQIRGEAIDARADIYSLGALLYRMLTGEPPFRASSPVGVLTKHLTEPLVPPSVRAPSEQIPVSFDRLVARAMAKDRGDRYASIDEVRRDVEKAYIDASAASGTSVSSGGWVRRAATPVDAAQALSQRARRLTEDDDDQRLNREDIDHFERRIRRRRAVRAVAVPVALAAALGGGAYWTVFRPAGAVRVEREPNNEPDRANVIALGTEVRGHIGRRVSTTESDRDVYRLERAPAPDDSEALSVELSALPNLDIALQVFDTTGHFVAGADAPGAGVGERIRNVRVPGPVLVVVTESKRRGGSLPTENVSDFYALTARLARISPILEVEPNDLDASALPLFADVAITGYLSDVSDLDGFRFEGSPGDYTLTLDGARDAAIAVRVRDGDPQVARSLALRLERGDIVRLRFADATAAARAGDEPYRLALTPR